MSSSCPNLMTGMHSSPSFRKRISQSPFVTKVTSIVHSISSAITKSSAPTTRAEWSFNTTTDGERLERLDQQWREYVQSIRRLCHHENTYPLITNSTTHLPILHSNGAASTDIRRVSVAICHLEHPLHCQPSHCQPPFATTRHHNIYLTMQPPSPPNTTKPHHPSASNFCCALGTQHKPLPRAPPEWELPGEVHRCQAVCIHWQ